MPKVPNLMLRFKVGQQAESKSFVKGYRGAWFRCKIKQLGRDKDSIKALLEFYDYPGEKMHWTKLYQKPLKNSIRSMDEQKANAAELILRPCFPPMYHENEVHDPNTVSDMVLIVNNVWKIGDLVDWWSDGCYWSGRITHLLSKDKVQIVLPDPPVGEGNSYEAFSDDLRPSLEWSLDCGWTVPESGTSHKCARLVFPEKEDVHRNENSFTLVSNTSFASCKSHSSVSSTGLDASSEVHKENYDPVKRGVCESCNTGTSGHSSTSASSLVSPTVSTGPLVHDVHSPEEDNEKQMETQSIETNLDLVEGKVVVASGKELGALSMLLKANDITRLDPGEENEREVLPTSMTLGSDECGKGKTCSFETSSGGSQEEHEKSTEIQSAHVGLESLGCFEANQVPKQNYLMEVTGQSAEIQLTCRKYYLEIDGRSTLTQLSKASTQSSGVKTNGMKVEIKPAGMNLASDAAVTTGIFDKGSSPDALPLYNACDRPQIHDRVINSLKVGMMSEVVQSTDMFVGTEDDKRQMTNFFGEESRTKDPTLSSDIMNLLCIQDQYNFKQLPKTKRMRVNEDYHPTAVAEYKAIESSILELEELANKIKWLKRMIVFGLQWSNTMKPSWKFSGA